MMGYARPLQEADRLFLVLVVVDAVVAVINPLILRSIINDGIGGNDSALVVKLALLAGLLHWSTRASRSRRYCPRASARA